MVQPFEKRKLLAITLFVAYRRRQKMIILDAAQEAASVTGFGKRTIRRYWVSSLIKVHLHGIGLGF